MNIVFYLLIAIALAILWFLLAFLFKPIGRFFKKLWNDTTDIINDEESEDE